MRVATIAEICIISVFILLFSLQFDSVRFAPVYAQLGAPNDENLDLNGKWQRGDGRILYITQEGNMITATFDPVGYCRGGFFELGEVYASTRLAFRGNLIGNTIQGEASICNDGKGTLELYDLQLTVNPDGKILDGVSTGPDGQLPLSLTFVGPTIGSSIEINSDKPVYDLKEPIEISGQITNVVNDRSDAFIEVYGPENEQVFSQTVSVNPDGSFLTNFELNNDENSKGTYRTVASYVEANDEITFEVGVEQPIAPGAAIATGAIIAAGSGGLFLLYKKGHLEGGKHMIKRLKEKVIKPHEIKTDTPSIIELRIECGLENSNDSEAFRRESSKGDNKVTGELAEMERKFSQAIDKILENRNKIKDIQTDIEFVKWCKEAGENPNKILSKISDEVISRFLISIQPYFQNLILSQIIAIESDISVTKDRPKRIRTNVTFSLNTIQAYIELVVYNNGVRVSSTKFIFAINSYVKIKNFTVHLEEVNRHRAQMKQLEQQAQYGDEETGNFNRGYRKRIETEDLLFGISIKLPKIKIGSIEKNIEPPFDLGKKEVGIKKCVLFFHDNKDQDTMSQEKDDSDGKL